MKHKMITIPHVGPIYPKGGVSGPITTPFRESVQNIAVLLVKGYKVEEVLPDGTSINLTLSNFDKDNSVKEEKELVTEKKEVEEKVEEAEATVRVHQESVESAVEKEETKPQQHQKNKGKNKNKHRQQEKKVEVDVLTEK